MQMSLFFYFDNNAADGYTAAGHVWCAGHTHTAFIQHGTYVNPNGYPTEYPLEYGRLNRKDFLLTL